VSVWNSDLGLSAANDSTVFRDEFPIPHHHALCMNVCAHVCMLVMLRLHMHAFFFSCTQQEHRTRFSVMCLHLLA
jgi:hypothetical protein